MPESPESVPIFVLIFTFIALNLNQWNKNVTVSMIYRGCARPIALNIISMSRQISHSAGLSMSHFCGKEDRTNLTGYQSKFTSGI